MNESHANNLFDPRRWGIPPEAVHDLPDRLRRFWERFRSCFQTPTRDTSEYAYHYLRGQLRMETERNFANIGRQNGGPEQNMHHFMSNSPWLIQAVFAQIQAEIAVTPGLEKGGVLILDESPDKKAGDRSAGAGRQWNGRLGKVEMSQVATLLAYANLSGPTPLWTWVAGELFLPKHWFSPEMAGECQRLGIPEERRFETKIELGRDMIQQVKANGLPFEAVACDELYGRSGWLRAQMRQADIPYMAEVPKDTQVYLNPETEGEPIQVQEIASPENTSWQRVRVRATERGELNDEFATQRVWTLWQGEPVEEWLVIRRHADGQCSYALSDAPVDTPLERLAWLKCMRHFVECSNQDAKSGAGWDEFRAQKYRAWEHELALTVLTCWFVAQTKWEWAQQYVRDPSLARQFEVDMLPALSLANIRELLRAVMPLPQLTPEQATALVVKHLVNRTRSRKSRMRHRARAP